MPKPLVGLCQMNVTNDKTANFDQGKQLILECKRRGACMAFLPEACDYIASNRNESISLAEPMDMERGICSRYQNLARSEGMWLSLGGLHRKCEGDHPDKFRISHVIIDANGNVQSVYDKCHLFSVDIPGKITLKETDTAVPGQSIGHITDTPVGKIGSMVCYDMRFPQISSELRRSGAEILTYPSAFTVPTGHAHWEVLLRARAIENQCYVVAAAQVDRHNDKRVSFGHSLVVNPWGTILACAADRVGVITTEIDLGFMRKLRTEMPVETHLRRDLY